MNIMRIPNLGETELLLPLQEGMFEQPMWSTFLDRLRKVSGCALAGLIICPADGGEAVELSSGDIIIPAALNALWSGSTDRWREGRVYSLEDLDDREWADDDLQDFRVLRIRSEAGLDGLLVLAASQKLSVSTSNLLSALAPHVRAALNVLVRLERERARASVNAGAFSHIDFGWISVDRQCRVVDMDEQAEAFLTRSSALRKGPYDRLTPASPEIDRQLTALVKQFAADGDARPRAVNLSEDPWIDILVSPVRVSSLSGEGSAVAVVYFRGDQSSSADRCQQLVELFNLTQSEARFAWSIAQGVSIAEAAEKHGLTLESARNYSKKVYAKTGAKGQVDLMRRILTSVVALTVH